MTTSKYFIGSLITEPLLYDKLKCLLFALECELKVPSNSKIFSQNLHITYVPPFFSSSEKYFEFISRRLTDLNGSIFALGDISWMEFEGVDILHIPIHFSEEDYNRIVSIREEIDRFYKYANQLPEKYYPHITLAKGEGLKEKLQYKFVLMSILENYLKPKSFKMKSGNFLETVHKTDDYKFFKKDLTTGNWEQVVF